jgi:hypothetical protein
MVCAARLSAAEFCDVIRRILLYLYIKTRIGGVLAKRKFVCAGRARHGGATRKER